ncbi:DNA-packaging protein [Salibacterium salarium]|uniref:DNA-packaging protein n=1 Tax=Salibacterium salarium TaxID=284579 RepID=A0A3R9QKC5_9BACI|nr:head-tail connector protein [Salibacterium salarium]RSL32664.1 DNA-packaging protein [Salibacterium salarium]
MLESVKKALRISNNVFDDEVQGLIDAAKMDLEQSGVDPEVINEDDPLIKRAVTVYCKAEFGYDNPDAGRFRDSYESLKNHLSLAGDYHASVE